MSELAKTYNACRGLPSVNVYPPSWASLCNAIHMTSVAPSRGLGERP